MLNSGRNGGLPWDERHHRAVRFIQDKERLHVHKEYLNNRRATLYAIRRIRMEETELDNIEEVVRRLAAMPTAIVVLKTLDANPSQER